MPKPKKKATKRLLPVAASPPETAGCFYSGGQVLLPVFRRPSGFQAAFGTNQGSLKPFICRLIRRSAQGTGLSVRANFQAACAFRQPESRRHGNLQAVSL